MRLLTLFFLPLYLWSQQIDVQWNWQGVEQLHVGDQLKRVPKAIGQTVFYDEEHQRFAISISKQWQIIQTYNTISKMSKHKKFDLIWK